MVRSKDGAPIRLTEERWKTGGMEGGSAETAKLFEKRPKGALNWDYDCEADVLYLSFEEPWAVVGADIGEGRKIMDEKFPGWDRETGVKAV